MVGKGLWDRGRVRCHERHVVDVWSGGGARMDSSRWSQAVDKVKILVIIDCLPCEDAG